METHPSFEPWGILIERNGSLVAAAILTRYRNHGVWSIGKPGGVNDPVHFCALDDEAAVQLAQAIYETVQSFGESWYLEVTDLPYPDPVANHLQATCPYSQTLLTSPIPCLRFAPGRSLNNYLSSNTRSAVAKARNRIKREGIVMTKNWSRDFEQIQETLGQVLDIYRRRDHQMFGQSLIDNPEAERFFLMFVTGHAKQNLIDLLTIHLDGQLAAFAVCLLDNDEHWVLVNKASPAWLRFSPGTIANAEVVAHAFEATDSHGVNWGGAPQRYKLSGEVTLMPRQTLFIWSSMRVKLFLNSCRHLTRLFNKGAFFAKKLFSVKFL